MTTVEYNDVGDDECDAYVEYKTPTITTTNNDYKKKKKRDFLFIFPSSSFRSHFFFFFFLFMKENLFYYPLCQQTFYLIQQYIYFAVLVYSLLKK